MKQLASFIALVALFLNSSFSFADPCSPGAILKQYIGNKSQSQTIQFVQEKNLAEHFTQNGSLAKQVEHFQKRFPKLRYENFFHSDVQVRLDAFVSLQKALHEEIFAKARPITSDDFDFLDEFEFPLRKRQHEIKLKKNWTNDEVKTTVQNIYSEVIDAYTTRDFSKLKILDLPDGKFIATRSLSVVELRTLFDEPEIRTYFWKNRIYDRVELTQNENYQKYGYLFPWFDELSLRDFTRHSNGVEFTPVGILNANDVAFADNMRMNVLDFFEHDFTHATDTFHWMGPLIDEIGLPTLKKLRTDLDAVAKKQTEGVQEALDRIVFHSIHEKPYLLAPPKSEQGLSNWVLDKKDILRRSHVNDFGKPKTSPEQLSKDLDTAHTLFLKVLKKNRLTLR